MAEDDKLSRAYALKTPDDSRALYADWAESYDADFADAHGYVLHLEVATAFVSAGGTGPILDLGAGTGLCGQALAALGAGPVDGTDISPEMLAKAAVKDVYRNLFAGDILAGLDVEDGQYPGLVSAGTFTLGHVGPKGLDEAIRVLRPGGLAVIAVRDSHFDNAGFDASLTRLGPHLADVTRRDCRIYAQGQAGDHDADRAILLHLRRA